MIYDDAMPGDFIFDIFPYIFGIMLFMIIGIFIMIMIKALNQKKKNDHSPILSVEATIVDKRQDVSRSARNSMNGTTSSSTFTNYYVTFEVESGSRIELEVPDGEYGFLVKGDHGKLTFQGTRFIAFKR